MKNRKIAVFLAVCLGIVSFSGCSSDMKNYRQASSDLEAEKYDEAVHLYATTTEPLKSIALKLGLQYNSVGGFVRRNRPDGRA